MVFLLFSLEINDDQVTEEYVATGKLVVEGNRYTPRFGGNAYPETFTLDLDKTPKVIDFTYYGRPPGG